MDSPVLERRFRRGREDWWFDGGAARQREPPVAGCCGHLDRKS